MNSQQGPMPPPPSEEEAMEKKRAIVWVDEKEGRTEEQKVKGLVTNASGEDLNLKDLEKLVPINTHRDASKQTGRKKTIKNF
mmetsp:Transcript_38589/g.50581  ORF Transcript_38589/g.50581 Transcript_38589/m.50581 type:complete len:82 (-) Transcript_38589:2659-2904(-)